jgi:hypothetical protein
VKPNIRIAPGQPTTVDIHVIHLPGGVKTPLSLYAALKALDIPVMDLTTCSRVCSLRGDKQGNNVDA